jgi:hypothetical protein
MGLPPEIYESTFSVAPRPQIVNAAACQRPAAARRVAARCRNQAILAKPITERNERFPTGLRRGEPILPAPRAASEGFGSARNIEECYNFFHPILTQTRTH